MKNLMMAASVSLVSASGLLAETVQPMAVTYAEGAVEAPHTTVGGDPVEGRKVFINRKLGNCLACHMNAEIPEQGFHGEVGPPLDGVGDRWTTSELRGIVSNAKNMFEGTIMPAFYVDSGFTRPLEKFEGKSILSAQQVEDVVAYLLTLKE